MVLADCVQFLRSKEGEPEIREAGCYLNERADSLITPPAKNPSVLTEKSAEIARLCGKDAVLAYGLAHFREIAVVKRVMGK